MVHEVGIYCALVLTPVIVHPQSVVPIVQMGRIIKLQATMLLTDILLMNLGQYKISFIQRIIVVVPLNSGWRITSYTERNAPTMIWDGLTQ